jgi:hypothetical protein
VNLLHGTGLNLRSSFGLSLMTEEPKTATEIVRMIKEQAYLSLGPWPIDLQIFIFGTTSGWRCGLSPATQASDSEYREAVLKIARGLQSTVSLIRRPEAGTEADKEDPPAGPRARAQVRAPFLLPLEPSCVGGQPPPVALFDRSTSALHPRPAPRVD